MFNPKLYKFFILILISLFICSSGGGAASILTLEETDKELVAENRQLALFMDPGTTEVMVYDKQSADLWFSNPPLREEEETRGSGRAKERLGNVLEVYYDEEGGSQNLRMSTLPDSVEEGLFEITPLEQGVRVDYTLGEEWEAEDYLPQMIGEARFQELIIDPVPEGERDFIADSFSKIAVQPRRELEEDLQFPGLDLRDEVEEFFAEYSVLPLEEEVTTELEEMIAREQPADAADRSEELAETAETLRELQEEYTYFLLTVIRDSRWEIEELEEIRREDLQQLAEIGEPFYVFEDDLFPFEKDDLLALLAEESAYHPREALLDHTRFGIDPPEENIEVLEIALEYRLDGEELVVSIPADEIVTPQEVEDTAGNVHTYNLHRIDFLPYLGATYEERDDGYIFVPDGSGALMRFDSNSSVGSYLSTLFYGQDLTLEDRTEKTRFIEQLYLPVYGIKQSDQALLGIIEKGASLAQLRAHRSGVRSSYNKVFPSFNIRPRGEIDLGQIGNITVYQDRSYEQDIQVRYSFLTGQEADYSGMAGRYRSYLVDKYDLTRLDPEQKLPFFLELTGGITRLQRRFGFPAELVEPLTSYEEVTPVVDELAERQVDNVKLLYQGWQAGGIHHDYPTGLNVAGNLGTQGELETLITELDHTGVELFLETGFLNIHEQDGLSNLFSSIPRAYYFASQPAASGLYNVATFGRSREFELLSVGHLPDFISGFLEEYEVLDNNRLALSYMGRQLHSDMGRTDQDLIIRPEAEELVAGGLDQLKDQNEKLLVRGANEYVLPAADYIVEVPEESSNFTVLDESVPFYQMVLSGYFHYTGQPMNLAHREARNQFLKMLETGGRPYFSWIYRDPHLIKDSEYDYLYSVYYRDWLEEAAEFYEKMNQVTADLQGQSIADHTQHQRGVYETTYENGVSILINYNDEVRMAEEREVPALGFKRIE